VMWIVLEEWGGTRRAKQLLSYGDGRLCRFNCVAL